MNEYPAHQTTGTWKRKILVETKSKKPLVLHDYRDCGSVTIANSTISRADVTGLPDDPISFLEYVENHGTATQQQDLYYLVCHMRPSREDFPTNPDSREGAGITPLFPSTTAGKKVIALQATTQASLTGVAEVKVVANNHYIWLPMNNREAYRKVDLWLPEFMDLDFDTAKTIAESADRSDPRLEKIQNRFRHLLDITHPGDATAELAFRLLCEAVVLCNGKPTGKVGDISITPPTQLGQWITAFSPAGNTDEQRIESLANMMGTEAAKTAAREVLKAVKGNNGLLDAARMFPGVPASSAPQQQPEEDGQ